MATTEPSGYSVDDLDWIRGVLGEPHLELDPWGNLIVTPASDLHEAVVSAITAQLSRQLAGRGLDIVVNGVTWRVPGGSGYLNVPDITVLPSGWHHREGEQLVPPPPLVIEVASPSTRTIDRGRKLADYRLGAAGAIVLVDVPTLGPAVAPTFELYQGNGPPLVSHDSIEVQVRGLLVALHAPDL